MDRPETSRDPVPASTGDARPRASERVSAAARDLFYRRGIRAVGVDEIVSEAGVTKPSLYRSFASKDALIVACLDEHRRETDAMWAAALGGTPDDPREQLRALIAALAKRMAGSDNRGCPISNAAVEFPEAGHIVHEAVCAFKIEKRRELRGLTARAGAADPELLADALILLIEGAGTSRHSFCGDGPVRAMVAAADALIDAMAPSAG